MVIGDVGKDDDGVTPLGVDPLTADDGVVAPGEVGVVTELDGLADPPGEVDGVVAAPLDGVELRAAELGVADPLGVGDTDGVADADGVVAAAGCVVTAAEGVVTPADGLVTAADGVVTGSGVETWAGVDTGVDT
ncbi:MAG: hypothetical protein ACM4D3_03925 [Candidatus Sericytochromatia bacterium]